MQYFAIEMHTIRHHRFIKNAAVVGYIGKQINIVDIMLAAPYLKFGIEEFSDVPSRDDISIVGVSVEIILMDCAGSALHRHLKATNLHHLYRLAVMHDSATSKFLKC